jgi:hypothetical protein
VRPIENPGLAIVELSEEEHQPLNAEDDIGVVTTTVLGE